jgi:hypothetical protein
MWLRGDLNKFRLFLAIFSLLTFVSLVSGQSTLTINAGEANTGENTTISISAFDVTDLANFDITVEYNPL